MTLTPWIILSSLLGASVSVLSWWLSMSKPGRKPMPKGRITAYFAVSALPAPLLALGGWEIVGRQFPWTHDTPYLLLLVSFLSGMASPSLVPKLAERLEGRVLSATEDLKS